VSALHTAPVPPKTIVHVAVNTLVARVVHCSLVMVCSSMRRTCVTAQASVSHRIRARVLLATQVISVKFL
jgi:hypothetical protein